MFGIQLENIGRRFNRDWIFRHVDYRFASGQRYAILGPNGSGKSTLLKIISGSLASTEGKISYTAGEESIFPEKAYLHLSVAAPYMELIEEFTLRELIDFHFSHKELLSGYTREMLPGRIGLGASMDKQLRFFSSGMKQRVKLALACFSSGSLLLLDEPFSNLDTQAIGWYQELLEETLGDRILIICSNQPEEYAHCGHRLLITDFYEKPGIIGNFADQ